MKNEKFSNKDLEDSLRRAFVDKRADYIIIDGQTMRNNFLTASLNYGIEKGLLQRGKDIDEDEVLGKGMGQYFANTYRLTDIGKSHLGLI